MTILTPWKRAKPFVRLAKVGQTYSGRTWIFTFVDPRHQLVQSVSSPWEAMATLWDVQQSLDERTLS